jgi:Alw26I/Eco31I/Esp3I family type II restriction m6 adenine DNA methyltransferase
MIYNIDYFREKEEKLIAEKIEIAKDFPHDIVSDSSPTEQDINNAFKSVHTKMISTLISFYMSKCCMNYSHSNYSDFFEGELTQLDILPPDPDYKSIPQICEALHISYLNSLYTYKNGRISRKKSKANLLEAGAVYTQEQIAYDIVYRTLANVKIENPSHIKVLDFATGTGRFYKQVVICLNQIFGLSKEDSVLNNIYAVDVDPIALNICRINALSQIENLDTNKAAIIASHIILKNALIKEDIFESEMAICKKDLEGLFFNGFHAIVSNPPYLVLKPNKNKMDTATVENINKMAKYFRNSTYYKYSIEGMLNLYQLSLEAMLGMLKKDGEMGIICPSTLFADISASSLRKHLLSKNHVSYIKFFSEDDPLFDNVTQATCIFHLTKGESTNIIDIVQGGKEYKISLEDVKQVFKSNWEIPSIEKVEWDILKKLLSFPLLKAQSFIRNKRGELDLSLFRNYITSEPTNLRLVRGNMLSGDSINDINHEYVKSEFLDKKSSDYMKYDHGKIRLVCQQISNQLQKVRLKFIECQKNDVLGNSCNYITVNEELIPRMKVLLNSALLNWRFKVTSTNNHINNYELDELPIIELSLITDEILKQDEVKQNKSICSLYGLKKEEINYIIRQHYETI